MGVGVSSRLGPANPGGRGMSKTVPVTLNVNGVEHQLDVEPRLLLVHALRDNLGLTGTHVGCDTSNCGYCTPGMIMAAAGLLAENPNPTEEEVRHGLEGNLCRCTGYHNIVKAVLDAAKSKGASVGAPAGGQSEVTA